jgi:hypothetical protein
VGDVLDGVSLGKKIDQSFNGMCLAHLKEAQFDFLFACALKIFRKGGRDESRFKIS